MRKLNYKKAFKISTAIAGITGVCGGFFMISKPLMAEINASFAMKEFRKHGLVETYRRHYHRFFEKVDNLATADLHEEVLLKELAEVRRDLEVEKAKSAEIDFQKNVKKISQKLKKKAGSHLARIPDEIEYEVPTTLQSYQLVVLGMEYFRKQQYEKSAMIFHHLMNREDAVKFRSPDHLLITAISWYKVKHFELANVYLDRVENAAAKGGTVYRQALLWKSMVRKSVGDLRGSQNLLTRLISYHPESEEAAMVNGMRKPASKSEAHEPEAHGQVNGHGGGSHE